MIDDIDELGQDLQGSNKDDSDEDMSQLCSACCDKPKVGDSVRLDSCGHVYCRSICLEAQVKNLVLPYTCALEVREKIPILLHFVFP